MFYIVFISGFIFSFLSTKKKFLHYIIIFYGTLLSMFLLAIFRYGIGPDYFSYKFLYEFLINKSILSTLYDSSVKGEVGFELISALLKKIGLTYQQYLSFFAFINLFFVGRICKKYSNNPILSLTIYFSLYYFVWTFSAIRQGITIPIGMYYFLEYLQNKNTKKMILISLILSTIHMSALILLLFILVDKAGLNKKHIVTLMMFSLVISTLPISNIIRQLNWLPISYRILPYLSEKAFLNNIFDFKTLGRLVFLMIGFIFYDVYAKQGKLYKSTINVYMVSLSIYFILKSSELMAARLSIYGVFLIIIIMPNIIYLLNEKFDRYMYIGFIFVFCSLYLTKELVSMAETSGLVISNLFAVPYVNVFNKDYYIFDSKYLNIIRILQNRLE
ncbi:hypothetical protein Calkr_2277 [Caldicellulosiruptor acetigenus I77R1B]|uniref:EpsG family protein n=2 Tax=Caldicellulosiruptor acetigenus TaxID=301953 RepID=G2PWB7_9FIRM|nr:EpsG family protein [Caldicellulosiruptor acetigenus]ADQ41731.1 hypothetical protein Calkr_2277 [Caldicellulosiruptor acetigenus I77R1B]AEM72861.1 hypothetical protein Calla_0176 [Caldicellulosiruptor acetigenus 6A]